MSRGNIGKGEINHVFIIFCGLADPEWKGYLRNLHLWFSHISRPILFHMQIYGLQRKEGSYDVEAASIVLPLFWRVGQRDC